MAADVISNCEIQFQTNFNSPKFEKTCCLLDEISGFDPDCLDLPPLEEIEDGKLDILLPIDDLLESGNDNGEENSWEVDDLFDVGMFDFGSDANPSASAITCSASDNNPDAVDSYPPLLPSKQEQHDAALCVPPNDSISSIDDCFLEQQNSFQMEFPSISRNDSDGLTDLEEQFNRIPEHPMLDQNFHAPPVPVEQNPFYSDIQFNWPSLNDVRCGNCQCYRQIIHSNGVQDTKLEIHGRNGQFYHAVMHARCSITGIASNMEQQTVDFAMATIEYVKQFVFQYNMLRIREGFVIRLDSLSRYPDPMKFDAMDTFFNPNTTPAFYNQSYPHPYYQNAGLGPPNSGFYPRQPLHGQYWNSYGAPYGMDQRGMPSNTPGRRHKSNVAAQRERTGKLKISDLAAYFHLPINVAAKELAICPTVLKKICRRNGMRRWPHRKIKSIERIIMTLEQTITEGNGQGVDGIREEIDMLKKVRAQLCSGVAVDKI